MADRWVIEPGGSLDAQKIAGICVHISDVSSVVVEHRFYRGSRAPHHAAFDDEAVFKEYLTRQVHPGDTIYVWSFDACCTDANVLFSGKLPDDRGGIPERGSY